MHDNSSINKVSSVHLEGNLFKILNKLVDDIDEGIGDENQLEPV